MAGRFFFAAVMVTGASSSAPAEEVTEAVMIEAARRMDPDVVAALAAAALVRSREVERGLYPNPELALERETLAGSAEDTLALTVPVDLSGRRSARRALARSDSAEARARAARTERAAVERALVLFYQGIAAERELVIAREAAAGLGEAARVLAHRRSAGSASGYEQARLEIEAELARSEVASAESRTARSRREIARFLGQSDVKLVGELEPGARRGPRAKPRSLGLLDQAAGSAREAKTAAGRAWLPTVLLSGGLRLGPTDDSGDRERGYALGLALELPIFSRGQDLRSEATARHAQSLAERAGAHRTDSLAAARAADELDAARAELIRLRAETGSRLERLARATATGYREGELSLVELIDAGRARADVARRLLALAAVARRAEIALRAARGELE